MTENKNEIEELAKEMYTVCSYPDPTLYENIPEPDKRVWQYRAGIVIDKLRPSQQSPVLTKEEILKIMPPPCLVDEFEHGECWRIDEVIEAIQKHFGFQQSLVKLDENSFYHIILENESAKYISTPQKRRMKIAKAIFSKFGSQPEVKDKCNHIFTRTMKGERIYCNGCNADVTELNFWYNRGWEEGHRYNAELVEEITRLINLVGYRPLISTDLMKINQILSTHGRN